MADSDPNDLAIIQNFIDWDFNTRSRAVSVAEGFGAFPLHLKHSDDFLWRLRFRHSGDGDPIQLTNLSEIRFVLLEKGRYNGVPLAEGVCNGDTWDDSKKCYPMAVSLNAEALKNYLATLDAISTGFSIGGYDCKAAARKAAGTVVTTTGTSGSSTTVTAPGKAQPSALVDYEFMGEFRWIQMGMEMRSQTFALWIARELITSASGSFVLAPPPAPTDWRTFAAMVCEGSVVNNNLFGYVRAPLDLEVLGMQVAVQQADPAQGFRIQLTDTNGTELGSPAGSQFYVDVPANTKFIYLPFGQVLAVNQGGEVRAKIKNYAGDTAAAVTVNLVCRQYVTNSAAGPSGGPGITSVSSTTLAPGAAATAQLTGQNLALGIPRGAGGNPGNNGRSITEVVISTLPPGAAATASLTALAGTSDRLNLGVPRGVPGTNGASVSGVQVSTLAPGAEATGSLTSGGVLLLGVPRGAKGDAGDVDNLPATVTATAHVDQVAYGRLQATVVSRVFTGRGKRAIIKGNLQNSDSVEGDQNLVRLFLYRSDIANPIAQADFVMLSGHYLNLSVVAFDFATATAEVTYSLQIAAFDHNSGSLAPRGGVAQGCDLSIMEFGS